MILNAIERLLILQPDNQQYKDALKKEKESEIFKFKTASVNKTLDYPDHPEQLVVRKNEYFPNGVREIDIWNFYDGIKNKLIQEFKNKDLFVVMAIKPWSELLTGKKFKWNNKKQSNYLRVLQEINKTGSILFENE